MIAVHCTAALPRKILVISQECQKQHRLVVHIAAPPPFHSIIVLGVGASLSNFHLPVISSVDLGDEDDGGDDDKCDDREAPGGPEHEHQHHGGLREAAQAHVQI